MATPTVPRTRDAAFHRSIETTFADLEQEARLWRHRARRRARLWKASRVVLGVAAAILGAAAGLTVLTSLSDWVPVGLGLGAAVISSLQAFMPSERRATEMEILAVDFSEWVFDLHNLQRNLPEQHHKITYALERLQKRLRTLQKRAVSAEEAPKSQAEPAALDD